MLMNKTFTNMSFIKRKHDEIREHTRDVDPKLITLCMMVQLYITN